MLMEVFFGNESFHNDLHEYNNFFSVKCTSWKLSLCYYFKTEKKSWHHFFYLFNSSFVKKKKQFN